MHSLQITKNAPTGERSSPYERVYSYFVGSHTQATEKGETEQSANGRFVNRPYERVYGYFVGSHT